MIHQSWLVALFIAISCIFIDGCIINCRANSSKAESNKRDAKRDSSPKSEGVKRTTLSVDGRSRSFLLFSPSIAKSAVTSSASTLVESSAVIDSQEQLAESLRPLVLVFHGSYSRGGSIMNYSKFNEIAEKQGIFVAYPDMDYRHSWELPEQFDNPEIPFIKALIGKVKTEKPIDSSRIYATGYSSGADFVQLLACHKEMAEQIAAFAPVCSNLDRAWSEKCQKEIPISMMLVNGTDDEITLWNGTKSRWMAVPVCFDFWSKQSGCVINRLESMFETAGSECQAVLLTAECKELSAEVALLEIDGGGHTWPGTKPQNWFFRRILGTTHFDMDANQAIWNFFSRHKLTRGN